MKFITDTFEKINDSLNPIVVKELRQAVQGKFLIVVLMLFLVVQLFTMGMGIFWANKSASLSFDAGREIFTVLLAILSATCLLFVPAYTGIRLASERSDANVDLLFITTLRPRSIIWGKFLAALILTILFYSACMPFMTFTYLLRGIDLPSIFILLAFNFIIIAASVQSAILIGCIPANRVSKAMLGVIWFVVVVGIFWRSTIFLCLQLLNAGIGSALNSWGFWRNALSVLVGGAALIGLFALLSTALISPSSANRALPVRIFFTIVWLLIGVGMAIWSIAIGFFGPVAAWVSLYILLYCIALCIAVSEREHLGQCVRQSIPRHWFRRLLVFPFYSGVASGVVWSSLMIILTLLSLAAWLIVFPPYKVMGGRIPRSIAAWLTVFPYRSTGQNIEMIFALAGTGLYAFSYALGASLIRRRFLANRVPVGYTWAIALVLLVIATTIIPLILFFSSGEWNQNWFIGSPAGLFVGLFRGDFNELLGPSVSIAIVSAVFVAILSFPWLIRQIDDFRPPRPKATSQPQTNALETPPAELKSTPQA